jgi:hypothetical protein
MSSKKLGTSASRHVVLAQPRSGLIHREQPPIEAVLDDLVKVIRAELRRQVYDGPKCRGARNALHHCAVLVRNVVMMNDHVVAADRDPLAQTAVAVEEEIRRDVHVCVNADVVIVGWILVETTPACDQLTAARRTLLQVASEVVEAAWRDVAVATRATGARHATPPTGLLAPRDELDWVAVVM